VTHILQSKLGRADNSKKTGASLMASGRVPKTNNSFMPGEPSYVGVINLATRS
jgi:hypothetical protein